MLKAFDYFPACRQAKYNKVAHKLLKGREKLMSFFDFPAEHWPIIRTLHPIESTFATLRYRARTTKGDLSCNAMLPVMFKLGQCVETRWRRLRDTANSSSHQA